MRKIAIITGSRGEYGYIRPVIREIKKDKDLDYFIIATNMHLLDEFGYSLQEIKKDKFKIGATIYNTLDGYNYITMAKSLGVFLLQLPDIINQTKPDAILLAGDRGEQLMAAIVGAHMYIPVAHIQAGEVSGNIDGTTRHAITKFAHIHFAANKEAANRVIAMGEEEFRVFNTGAPMLDELLQGHIASKKGVYKKLNLNPNQPLFLVVQHPVTEEFRLAEKQITETMEAVSAFNNQTIVILPNSDAGSRIVKSVIQKYRKPFIKVFRNLPRKDYAGILNAADVMIGNSSSGIIEAPSFHLPVANIGNRQKGRQQSTNVINVPHNKEKIKTAIKMALNEEFKKKVNQCTNPYGDGKSSKRIINALKTIKFDDRLLNKKLRY